MAINRCPYLGSQEDRETAFEFPADQNTCYKASPAGPVTLEYQKKFCLNAHHQSCPVYLANQPVALPAAAAAAPISHHSNLRGRYLVIALAAFLLLGLGALAVLAARQPNAAVIPNTGGSPTPTEQFVGGSPVEDLLNSSTQIVTPARPDCPLPENWTIYTAQPTDSFSLLSGLYNISMENLLRANCLEPGAALQPGEIIYVPLRLDLTGTPPATPTTQVLLNNPVTVPPASQPNPTNPPAATAVIVQPTAALAPSPTALPQATATLESQPTATTAPTQLPPASTEPPPPSSFGQIVVTDSGKTLSINCAGADVTVRGSNNTIALLGTCSSLTVTGNNNRINLENPTDVNDSGNNNDIN